MIYGIRENKPILMADVSKQPDWNQTDETKKDFIKNKPDFEGQIRELQDSLSILVSEDSGKIKEIEDKLKELEDGLDELKESTVSKDEFETAIDELEQAISTLTGIAENDKAELEAKIKELEDSLDELKTASVTQEQLETIMSDLDDTINEIKAKLEELEDVDEELEEKIQDLQDKLDTLEESVITKNRFDEVIIILENSIKDLENRIEALENATTEDKAELEERLRELEELLEELRNISSEDIEEIKSKILEIEGKLSQIEDDIDDIRSECLTRYTDLIGQIDDLKEEIDSLNNKVKEYQITYDVNTGEDDTCPESFKTIHNVFIISNMIPMKSDKHFHGWSLNQNAAKAEYLPKEMIVIEESITLYAVWGDEEVVFDNETIINQPRELKQFFGVSTIPEVMEKLRLRCQNGDFTGLRDGDYVDGLDLSEISAPANGEALQVWNDTTKNNRFEISGINTYRDVKKNGDFMNPEDHIIFTFTNCVTLGRMNSQLTNTAGYLVTELKDWVDNTFTPGLEQKLGITLCSLSKNHSTKNSYTWGNYKVWIPSEIEIFGNAIHGDETLDNSSSKHLSMSSKVKQHNGVTWWWWTQTPALNSDNIFVTINDQGSSVSSNLPDDHIGIVLSFSV